MKKPPANVNRTPMTRLWRNGEWLALERVRELTPDEFVEQLDTATWIAQASVMFPLVWLTPAEAKEPMPRLLKLVQNGALNESDDAAYDEDCGVAFCSLWQGDETILLVEVSH
jgi:hypothetical protein